MVKITDVCPSSDLYKAGVRKGDVLISVNRNDIRDVLDYRFYITERNIEARFLRDGEEYSVSLRKGEYEDIGLSFETPLMDKKHHCKNGCIFCFVDQMPKGLRDTLYFKDDDSRLSFLHGNYITLTNMTEDDIDRIIKMRISPINISVHTTNPDLRVSMMKNKRAGEVLSYLPKLAAAGIELCTQLVLCPGINDGEELLRSMRDLKALCPSLISCAAVPVGITKFRDGLCPLREYEKDEAAEIVRVITEIGDECLCEFGSRIFTAADEFYLKAELPIPGEEYYEGYPQLENGVGLVRSLLSDLEYFLEYEDREKYAGMAKEKVLALTGYAAYDTMKTVVDMLSDVYPHLDINVTRVINDFFGESVTVAGLLTGRDMLSAINAELSKEKYDRIVIPDATLKADEDVFLCGMTLDELRLGAGLPIFVSANDPEKLTGAFLGEC